MNPKRNTLISLPKKSGNLEAPRFHFIVDYPWKFRVVSVCNCCSLQVATYPRRKHPWSRFCYWKLSIENVYQFQTEIISIYLLTHMTPCFWGFNSFQSWPPAPPPKWSQRQTMADVDQRFFCHQCSVEIPRIAADFTCPTCNSGELVTWSIMTT